MFDLSITKIAQIRETEVSLEYFQKHGCTTFVDICPDYYWEYTGQYLPESEFKIPQWNSNAGFDGWADTIRKAFGCSKAVADIWLYNNHLPGFNYITIPQLLSAEDIEYIVGRGPFSQSRVPFTEDWFRLGCPDYKTWRHIYLVSGLSKDVSEAKTLAFAAQHLGLRDLEVLKTIPGWRKMDPRQMHLAVSGFGGRLATEALEEAGEEFMKTFVRSTLLKSLKGNIRSLRGLIDLSNLLGIGSINSYNFLSEEAVDLLAKRKFRILLQSYSEIIPDKKVFNTFFGYNMEHPYREFYSYQIHKLHTHKTPVKLFNEAFKTVHVENIAELGFGISLLGHELLKKEEYIDLHNFFNVYNVPVNYKKAPKFSQQWNQFFTNNPGALKYWESCVDLPSVPKSLKALELIIAERKAALIGEHGPRMLWAGVQEYRLETCALAAKKYTSKIVCNLPEVFLKDGDYKIVKLGAGDIAHLFIGLATDCCQHLNGAGKACAIHSYTESNSSTYVITKSGLPVAQSWVWRDGDKLVIDSIEYKRGLSTDRISIMYLMLARSFKSQGFEVYLGKTSYGGTLEVLDSLKASGFIRGEAKSYASLQGYGDYMDGVKHYLLSV